MQDALNKVGIGAIALLALLLTSSIPTPDAALQVANNKLVLTYYFYWYDYATGLHMDNCGNSLALRPVNLSSVSYYSVATVVVPSQNYSSYIGIGMAAVVVAVVAAFALKRRARH